MFTEHAAGLFSIVPRVDLPVMPPIKPMLAKTVAPSHLRSLRDVQLEPKWDQPCSCH